MKSSLKDTIVNIFKKNEQVDDNKDPVTEATFEAAISSTGFGKFNLLLIATAIPCGWSSMFASGSMSFVAPVAHCDLDMTLEQKGMLNAIAYLGMIISASLWGFLADTLGRKRILVYGFLADSIFVIIAGFAQSYEMLLSAKFINGLIINGPFAALTTVVSEFHSAGYRTRVLLYLGIIYSTGQLILPGVAWLIIPHNMDYEFLDGNFRMHSWNFFIIVCAIPSLLGSLAYSFLPESPKFLMMVGRNDEAMRVFKRIYSLNNGLDPETFPIKSLMDESKLHQGGKHGGLVTANRTKTQAIKEGFQQIQPIFFPPLLWLLLLVSTIQCGIMMGANTIRLWLPQIFTAINDYQLQYPNETSSLCTMLDAFTPKDSSQTLTETAECIVNTASDFVYINTMIVTAVSILGYIIIGSLINICGKKPTIFVCSLLSGVAMMCFYFSKNATTTTALAAINSSFVVICLNILIAVVVDIFPTNLRTIAVALLMMIGRSGSMIGNVIFPYLLLLGCMPPFMIIGAFIVICAFLSLLLPKTDMKAMI